MAAFSTWESRFPPEHAERGPQVTEEVWEEMRSSDPDELGVLSRETEARDWCTRIGIAAVAIRSGPGS
jgi:hypothetical protein